MSNCCPEFYPIKVSQLARYQNIDLNDFLLVIESGSANYSRRSNIADLIKSFKLFPTGSYSGSFSGSFNGKVLSKNVNLSGALSGSYLGSVFSKNTIASGSFSGSHYGKLVSKNSKATGSFKGTFFGDLYGFVSGSIQGSFISKNTKATGSFSGSLYGNLFSKNTIATGSFSGSYYGKLVSKNSKATGSFSGSLFGKSIFSNTSSYLKKESNQSYKFTYFNNKELINSPYFSYDPTYYLYYFSSSNSSNYLIVDSKASNTFAQSGLILSNNYDRKNRVPSYNWGPEGWRLFTNASGSLDLASLTGSYQFANANFTAKGLNPYFSALRTVNNVFYFWPEPNSYNTITRDASLAIGLTAATTASATPRTKARLHISVFSSSVANRGRGAWSGNGTVRQLDGAIYVEYGSGSLASPLQRTFFVSGSGNMYSAGTLTVARGISASLSGSTFGKIYSKNTTATGSFSGSIYGNLVSKNAKLSGSFSGSFSGNVTTKKSLITGSFRGLDNIINFKGTGKKVSFNGTSSYSISSSYALTASYFSPGTGGSNIISKKVIEIPASNYGSPLYTVSHGCPSQPFGFVLNWIAGATPQSGLTAGDVLAFDQVFGYWTDAGPFDRTSPWASVQITGNDLIVGWINSSWARGGGPFYGYYIYKNSINNAITNPFTPSKWNLRITLFY